MSRQVLIVDDSLPLHKLVQAYLKSDGLTMHSAFDGESGLTCAERLQPSLILLDVDMPRLDGFEVCRRLKNNPATARIPVIFLTANSMLDNRVMGLDIGASDYITKPFKPGELRARVRASLRARHQMESQELVDRASGLWNRTYLNAHLDVQVSLAKRSGDALSCIVVEVNHDSAPIANLSAPAATDVLRTITQVFSGRCRTEDVVCRLDPWKFAILATRADRSSAAMMAERLRAEVERQMRSRNGHNTRLIFSTGVADTLVSDAATLVDRAEAALSGSRCVGFNRVVSNRMAPDLADAAA
jgi:diguanylate cyclase (GGDEF)-like protein